ncbi:MAG: hypothetical protein ACO3XO_02815 [Bdellovibrionota bacterium]
MLAVTPETRLEKELAPAAVAPAAVAVAASLNLDDGLGTLAAAAFGANLIGEMIKATLPGKPSEEGAERIAQLAASLG